MRIEADIIKLNIGNEEGTLGKDDEGHINQLKMKLSFKEELEGEEDFQVGGGLIYHPGVVSSSSSDHRQGEDEEVIINTTSSSTPRRHRH